MTIDEQLGRTREKERTLWLDGAGGVDGVEGLMVLVVLVVLVS